MRSRREPLLWIQCLAFGVIPLELLLIRLLLAGADPGPVPSVERLLTWGVAVLAPAVALWRQPADWGSLLLVRVPTRTRTEDQQTLSARQGGPASTLPLIAAAVLLLPLLWWLDDSAGLISEFSPLNGSSRLLCLLLSVPVLALIVWQLQQLGQAGRLLLMGAGEAALYPAEQLSSERSSFGLQLLQLAPLDWPEAAPKPTATPEPTPETQRSRQPNHLRNRQRRRAGTTAVEPEQRGAEDQGSPRCRHLRDQQTRGAEQRTRQRPLQNPPLSQYPKPLRNRQPSPPSTRLRSNQSREPKRIRAPPWMPTSPRPAEVKRSNQRCRQSQHQIPQRSRCPNQLPSPPQSQKPKQLRNRNLNQSVELLRSNQSREAKRIRAPPWMPTSPRSTALPAERRKSMVNSPGRRERTREHAGAHARGFVILGSTF